MIRVGVAIVTMRYFLKIVTVTMRYSLIIVTVTMSNLFQQKKQDLSKKSSKYPNRHFWADRRIVSLILGGAETEWSACAMGKRGPILANVIIIILFTQFTATQNGQIVTLSGNSVNLHGIKCPSVSSTDRPQVLYFFEQNYHMIWWHSTRIET